MRNNYVVRHEGSKKFELLILVFKLNFSNRSEVEDSVSHDVKGFNLARYVHLHKNSLKCPKDEHNN